MLEAGKAFSPGKLICKINVNAGFMLEGAHRGYPSLFWPHVGCLYLGSGPVVHGSSRPFGRRPSSRPPSHLLSLGPFTVSYLFLLFETQSSFGLVTRSQLSSHLQDHGHTRSSGCLRSIQLSPDVRGVDLVGRWYRPHSGGGTQKAD